MIVQSQVEIGKRNWPLQNHHFQPSKQYDSRIVVQLKYNKKKSYIIVGIGDENSIEWAFRTLKDKGSKKPLLLAWIHSHVRGAECCFSSIDCHTQHSYSKIHKGVLGLVIEIGHDGQKGVHEFYEMSYYGKQIVEICSHQMALHFLSKHSQDNKT